MDTFLEPTVLPLPLDGMLYYCCYPIFTWDVILPVVLEKGNAGTGNKIAWVESSLCISLCTDVFYFICVTRKLEVVCTQELSRVPRVD